MSKKKPAAMKALRDYCDRIWTKSDFHQSDNDLVDESDRSLIVLMGTRVETALKCLLKEKMPRFSPKFEESLFGGYKPLSTFSAKIDVADAFGLITEREAEKLHHLREIRNRCAHADKHLSFSTSELRNAAALIVPDEFSGVLAQANSRDVARTNFLGMTSYYCAIFYLGREKAREGFLSCIVKN